MVLHGSVTFNYFLLSYLTNLFVQIYTTAFYATFSEIIGYFVSGYLIERFGVRKAFLISSIQGMLGGMSILFYGL